MSERKETESAIRARQRELVRRRLRLVLIVLAPLNAVFWLLAPFSGGELLSSVYLDLGPRIPTLLILMSVGIFIFALVWGQSSSQISATIRWLAPLTQILAFVIPWFAIGDKVPHRYSDFYSIAAQIIPVLVLALAFQGRLLRLPISIRRFEPIEAYTVGAFILLAWGEAVALYSVFTGEPGDAGIVVGALCSGFVGILLRAIQGGLSLDRPEDQ